MNRFTDLVNLKVGHQVKVKGKMGEDGSFMALEISMKTPEEEGSFVGMIQDIDYQKKSIRIFNNEVIVNDEVEIKDLQRNDADFKALKVGSMIKLKGRSENSTGLVPIQIKIRQTFGFNIEKIKGKIDAVDFEKNTLKVMGIEVIANEKTAIETL